MEGIAFGVHLPVMKMGEEETSRDLLFSYARKAEDLGFSSLSVNDHIVYRRDWLDPLTALASVAAATTKIRLGTSILNIVARNPVICAKSLSSIDILSCGRLFAGVGPGSHKGDYDVCGIPFEERWGRFRECLEILAALWSGESVEFAGRFYRLDKVSIKPPPMQMPHPPIFVGSWGSETILKQVAKYADGWMASAYNITPDSFKEKWKLLLSYRRSIGKDVDSFQNSVTTMFGYISSEEKAKRMAREVLSPALGRSTNELESLLLFGTASQCILKLRRLFDAGVNCVYFWPVIDYQDQIQIFVNEIITAF